MTDSTKVTQTDSRNSQRVKRSGGLYHTFQARGFGGSGVCLWRAGGHLGGRFRVAKSGGPPKEGIQTEKFPGHGVEQKRSDEHRMTIDWEPTKKGCVVFTEIPCARLTCSRWLLALFALDILTLRPT